MLWGHLSKQFFDQWMPQYVKATYSPKAAWKDRPFGLDDVRFFSRSVEDLSHRFTSKQGSLDSKRIYSQARFRSAYLLYFLPFQASKFKWAFDKHGDAWAQTLDKDTKSLEIWDWGAGCATASIAWLLWYFERKPKTLASVQSISLIWVEPEQGLLKDAEALVRLLESKVKESMGPSAQMPSIHIRRVPISIERFEAKREAPLPQSGARLSIFGHVWNEGLFKRPRAMELVHSLLRFSNGYALFIEPAIANIAQWISHLRDAERELNILGPCLHQGLCPLATGRDWCHFSPHVRLELKWWHALSKAIGPEREFLKFSYVFFSGSQPQIPAGQQRLVVSDVIPMPRPHVLLCEPDKPRVHSVPATMPTEKRGHQLMRGDIIRMESANRPSPKQTLKPLIRPAQKPYPKPAKKRV